MRSNMLTVRYNCSTWKYCHNLHAESWLEQGGQRVNFIAGGDREQPGRWLHWSCRGQSGSGGQTMGVWSLYCHHKGVVGILISSIFESYPGLCLGQSLTHSVCLSTIFLPNERENILVSSVCGSVGIKYSSQILQSCSKLGGSFRHSVSFQCLFKLRN